MQEISLPEIFFVAFKSANLFITLSIIYILCSFIFDTQNFQKSTDMDYRKKVFIRINLLKLLSPPETVVGIVSIILNAIRRFGTFCNLLL